MNKTPLESRVDKVILDLLLLDRSRERRRQQLTEAGVTINHNWYEPVEFVFDLLGVPETSDKLDRQELKGVFDEMMPDCNQRAARRYLKWLKAEIANS